MRKTVTVVVLLAAVALLVPTDKPQAQGAIYWQTSFDCPEWRQSNGLSDADVCGPGDYLSGDGGWVTSRGNQDQITAAANNPLGTGRGFRHWRGEVSGNNGGGLKIGLPQGLTEVWFRWYTRFSPNVQWQTLIQTKDLYINAGSAGSFTLGVHDGLSPGTFGIAYVPTSLNMFGSPGWSVIGNGQWHFLEFHVKTTSPTIAESWVDGQLVHRNTNVPFATPVNYIVIGSNHCCTLPGSPDFYNDYDDIAISRTGYIGPIGGSSSSGPSPSAPTNLRITS